MNTMKDYAKEVTKSAGIHKGSSDEKIVHEEIYRVMGGEYKPFNQHLLNTYNSKIANNIRRTDAHLGNKVVSHLSSVLKK